jgi:hypothetical protein
MCDRGFPRAAALDFAAAAELRDDAPRFRCSEH